MTRRPSRNQWGSRRGIKAVNALSSSFVLRSVRDGQIKEIEFQLATSVRDEPLRPTKEDNGTEVIFVPDEANVRHCHFISEYVESMLKNYSYLNAGMIINFNGNKIISRNGLVDLLNDNMNQEGLIRSSSQWRRH